MASFKKRHPKKSKNWLIKRYWKASGRTSMFSVRHKTVDHGDKVYTVIRLCNLPRSRFVKIKADANPYNKEDAEYFYRRRHPKRSVDNFAWQNNEVVHPAAKELGALSAKAYRSGKVTV